MKRKSAEKAPNHERWLLTYADMITLLMIFFIVLYTMSKADSEKFRLISASLQRAFAVEVYQAPLESSALGEGMLDARLAAFTALRSRLGAVAQALNVSDDVEVRLVREGILISLSGNFLFESGRAELRSDAYPLLDSVSATVRELPNEIRVSGHTDNIPIETPLYASNWELSTARAVAVVKYLAATGIEGERLAATGYGEFRPSVPNDSRANRAKNRRAELLVVFPEAPSSSDPFRDLFPSALPDSSGASSAPTSSAITNRGL